MRKYEVAALYVDVEGVDHLYGYALLNTEIGKLQISSVYGPDEHDDVFAKRNEFEETDLIRAHWPDGRDPDVTRLLDDANFAPVGKEDLDGAGAFEAEFQRTQKAAERVARVRAGLA